MWIKGAEHAVLDSHIANGQAERKPVLVKRQQRDHHEEVKVGLNLAVPAVDEHGRRRQQPEHHGHRTSPAAGALEHPHAGRNRHRQHRSNRAPHPEPFEEQEHRKRDDVPPEDQQHGAVAARPLRMGQRLTARQNLSRAHHSPADGAHHRPSQALRALCARSKKNHMVTGFVVVGPASADPIDNYRPSREQP
jgi:hypothetical protein